MDYISTKEAAALWGITPRRVAILCGEGRIPGAYQLGRTWAIPRDAQKPIDARQKSEREKKEKAES